jgi:hypothetical protein
MIPARSVFLFSCVILAILGVAAFAATSDFSGSYSLGAPTAAGEDVQITISLVINNNTGGSVRNAVIALHDPRAARVTYGQLTGLTLPAGSRAETNGSFIVPKSLYDSWQKGSSPAMSVSFTDAKGNAVRTFIEF